MISYPYFHTLVSLARPLFLLLYWGGREEKAVWLARLILHSYVQFFIARITYSSWFSWNIWMFGWRRLIKKDIDKGLSIRKVSDMYGIPRSTLHDHVSGKVAYGAKRGPDPYLDLNWRRGSACKFFDQVSWNWIPMHAHTKNQTFALVQQMLDKKGIEAIYIKWLMHGLWERFKNHHPNVANNSCCSSLISSSY